MSFINMILFFTFKLFACPLQTLALLTTAFKREDQLREKRNNAWSNKAEPDTKSGAWPRGGTPITRSNNKDSARRGYRVGYARVSPCSGSVFRFQSGHYDARCGTESGHRRTRRFYLSLKIYCRCMTPVASRPLIKS